LPICYLTKKELGVFCPKDRLAKMIAIPESECETMPEIPFLVGKFDGVYLVESFGPPFTGPSPLPTPEQPINVKQELENGVKTYMDKRKTQEKATRTGENSSNSSGL